MASKSRGGLSKREVAVQAKAKATAQAKAKATANSVFKVPTKKVEPRMQFANGESIKQKNVVSVEDMLNPNSKANAKLKAQSDKANAKSSVPTQLAQQINKLAPQKRSEQPKEAPKGVLAKLIYNVSNAQKGKKPTPTKEGRVVADTVKNTATQAKNGIASNMRNFIANPISTVAESLSPKVKLDTPKFVDGKVKWEKSKEKGNLAEAFPQIGVGGFAGTLKNVSKNIIEGIAKETKPSVIKQVLTTAKIPHNTSTISSLVKETNPVNVNKILQESSKMPKFNVAKNLHPEDKQALTSYIDAVRGKKDMSEAQWTAGERLLTKAGVSLDKPLSTLANHAEDIITGKRKLVTILPGTPKAPTFKDRVIAGLNKKEKGFVANPFATKQQDEVGKYIAEQTQKREIARENQGFTPSKFYKEIKAKLVDSNAPIEDTLRQAQKKGQFEILPSSDISGQIDRVLRTPTLSGQFARENGLERIIKANKSDIEALDQYLIAKHSQTLEAKGIQTGRNSEMDAKLLAQLGPKFEKTAKEVNAYSQKLLDYSTKSGLISKETSTKLKQMYPDYVPMNRIFSELETSGQFGTKAVASLSKQTVVQGIKGSAREVESPLASLLSKTSDAFAQGEKNKAAKMLASYEKLPGNPFGLREIKEGEKVGGLHTISFLDNGIKKTFEVNPDIAQAAKAMNVQQMNILGKIFSLPVRLAKLGITGINPAFVMANVAKDNVFAFITSKNGIKTSLANPVVFAQSLFNALGHGKLYQEMVRSGAGGTSFDIARNQGMKTVNQLRGLSAPGVGNKIKYVVDTPARLLHAVEDIVGRGEEMTRLQQFIGTKNALIKEGRTANDARLLASKAARENTANFARRGEWGTVLNSAFMYLNAGIQGSRSFIRAMEREPIKTTTKLATVLFMPVATITAYNLNDEKRRQVYEDLPDYEKQNNLILIPDNVTKDEKGKYNVIKIPLPPGLSSLSDVVRRAVEQAHGLNPLTFSEIAKDLIGSVSPITPETNSVLSTLTPQAVKPSLEASLNKNIFTGSPQVPRSLEGLPPEAQTKPGISAVSNILGKKLGVSPIKIEEWVKGTFGGTGLNVLNSIDKGLAKTGKIKDEEIGGQSFIQSITARFTKATGGEENRKQWDAQAKQKEQDLLKSKQEKEALMPQYNAVQDAKKAGNEDKAQELVDKMTDEEYKTYIKIRQSERTKNSQTVKALINSNPKKAVQYVRSLPEYEQQRIIDNLSDAEYTVYSLGK